MSQELQQSHAQAGAAAARTGKSGEKWWQSMLWAAVLVAGGVWFFHMFDDLEKHGGSIRMNRILIFIYDHMGKWGVLYFFLAVALAMFASGVNQLRKKRAAA